MDILSYVVQLRVAWAHKTPSHREKRSKVKRKNQKLECEGSGVSHVFVEDRGSNFKESWCQYGDIP